MMDDDLNYRQSPLTPARQAHMIAAAMAAPQNRSLAQILVQALSEWRYGLPVKAGALAGLAAAGFIMGFSQPAPMTELTAIAMPDTSFLEAQL